MSAPLDFQTSLPAHLGAPEDGHDVVDAAPEVAPEGGEGQVERLGGVGLGRLRVEIGPVERAEVALLATAARQFHGGLVCSTKCSRPCTTSFCKSQGEIEARITIGIHFLKCKLPGSNRIKSADMIIVRPLRI